MRAGPVNHIRKLGLSAYDSDWAGSDASARIVEPDRAGRRSDAAEDHRQDGGLPRNQFRRGRGTQRQLGRRLRYRQRQSRRRSRPVI